MPTTCNLLFCISALVYCLMRNMDRRPNMPMPRRLMDYSAPHSLNFIFMLFECSYKKCMKAHIEHCVLHICSLTSRYQNDETHICNMSTCSGEKRLFCNDWRICMIWTTTVLTPGEVWEYFDRHVGWCCHLVYKTISFRTKPWKDAWRTITYRFANWLP